MIDTLGIDGGTLIAIIALVSIWAYPSIFVHLYAARKLDEARHRDIEVSSTRKTPNQLKPGPQNADTPRDDN